MKPIDPNQAWLAGFLLSCCLKQCPAFFTKVQPGNIAPEGFELQLASGLRLQIRVDVVEELTGEEK